MRSSRRGPFACLYLLPLVLLLLLVPTLCLSSGRRQQGGPPAPTPALVVDPSTIKNKVLAGYQGWFGNPATGVPGYNWWHWALHNNQPPGPTNSQFDMFPDLSEYPESALQATNLTWKNGTAIGLYDNSHVDVVDVHFRWMQQYGLDGVLLQRFISDTTNPAAHAHFMKVLDAASASATKYGRTFGIMYDITNANAETFVSTIKSDFQTTVLNYTKSSSYLHEGGKPVVCVFGLGLNQNPKPPANVAIDLINWLKERAYVIGSGAYFWRVGGHDSIPGYDKVYATFDAVMPWAVGRYNSVPVFETLFKAVVVGDAAKCKKRGQGYAPITFPGYSFHHSSPGTRKFNEIPRLGGAFMQAQVLTDIHTSKS